MFSLWQREHRFESQYKQKQFVLAPFYAVGPVYLPKNIHVAQATELWPHSLVGAG